LIRTRSHDRAPVPWAITGRGFAKDPLFEYEPVEGYDEASAAKSTGPKFDEGWRLMEYFLSQDDVKSHHATN
jgi:hypothetical protein